MLSLAKDKNQSEGDCIYAVGAMLAISAMAEKI